MILCILQNVYTIIVNHKIQMYISFYLGVVPKVMSVALIEPFDRWFLSLSKGSGTTRRNDCYTKCGGFDKLNHRNANLFDTPLFLFCITPKRIFKYRTICILYSGSIKIISHICIFRHFFKTFIK